MDAMIFPTDVLFASIMPCALSLSKLSDGCTNAPMEMYASSKDVATTSHDTGEQMVTVTTPWTSSTDSVKACACVCACEYVVAADGTIHQSVLYTQAFLDTKNTS
jgi:hypothetical protein